MTCQFAAPEVRYVAKPHARRKHGASSISQSCPIAKRIVHSAYVCIEKRTLPTSSLTYATRQSDTVERYSLQILGSYPSYTPRARACGRGFSAPGLRNEEKIETLFPRSQKVRAPVAGKLLPLSASANARRSIP